jgi:hypothetical protein
MTGKGTQPGSHNKVSKPDIRSLGAPPFILLVPLIDTPPANNPQLGLLSVATLGIESMDLELQFFEGCMR